MTNHNPYDPPQHFESPPEDPHSGTRLVIVLFALPVAYFVGWTCFTVGRAVMAEVDGHDFAIKSGYVAAAMGVLLVAYLTYRAVQTFSQPTPLTPEEEDEIEPDDDDLPADWEKD